MIPFRRFTDGQRDELLALGLLQQQVATIEEHALPLIVTHRAAEKAKPAAADVGQRLAELRRRAEALRDEVGRWMAAQEDRGTPAAVEAANRLLLADFDSGGHGEALRQLDAAAVAVVGLIDIAESERPRDAVRRRTANPVYVEFIHRALVGGLNDPAADGPIRPFMMAISAGKKQPFRRVVEVCFDAAGIGDCERALKGFIKWRSGRRRDGTPS